MQKWIEATAAVDQASRAVDAAARDLQLLVARYGLFLELAAAAEPAEHAGQLLGQLRADINARALP